MDTQQLQQLLTTVTTDWTRTPSWCLCSCSWTSQPNKCPRLHHVKRNQDLAWSNCPTLIQVQCWGKGSKHFLWGTCTTSTTLQDGPVECQNTGTRTNHCTYHWTQKDQRWQPLPRSLNQVKSHWNIQTRQEERCRQGQQATKERVRTTAKDSLWGMGMEESHTLWKWPQAQEVQRQGLLLVPDAQSLDESPSWWMPWERTSWGTGRRMFKWQFQWQSKPKSLVCQCAQCHYHEYCQQPGMTVPWASPDLAQNCG